MHIYSAFGLHFGRKDMSKVYVDVREPPSAIALEMEHGINAAASIQKQVLYLTQRPHHTVSNGPV